jgi:hypothetical protein
VVFGIELHLADNRPVSGLSRPTLGPIFPGSQIKLMSGVQDLLVTALVTVLRGYKSQSAVKMYRVVPGYELRDPFPGGLQGFEGFSG